MKRTPLVSAIVATVAGTAIALALPASAAVSQQSPPVAAMQIGSPALLQARGAAITVPLTVVCAPGNTVFGSVHVSQRVGSEVANGSGFVQNVPCTGNFQTVNVNVNAEAGKAFKKGTAFASATVSVCDPTFNCATLSDARDITISK